MTTEIWTIPDTETYELVAEGRRLADQLHDQTGEETTVVAVSFPDLTATDLEPYGPDSVVQISTGGSADAFADGGASTTARAHAIAAVADERTPDAILLPEGPTGEQLAGSIARRVGGGCVTDCLLRVRNSELVAGRLAFDDRAYAEFSFEDGPAIASVRSDAIVVPESIPDAEPDYETVQVDAVVDRGIVCHAVREVPESDLSRARRIVSGGYGLGGPEGFEAIDDLADALSAAVGASRPPADEDWVPYDRQIGVTGKEIDVELYVPCAISGDPYHMRSVTAEYLIPINNDPDAAIFDRADIGIVGDAHEYVPALANAIREAKRAEMEVSG